MLKNRLPHLGALLVVGTLMVGCGGSDSKAEACAAWETAMKTDEAFMAYTQEDHLSSEPSGDLGDLEADVDDALDELEAQTGALSKANSAAKDAFATAAADDPEWEKVQEAAYQHLSTGDESTTATVEAACDRVQQ